VAADNVLYTAVFALRSVSSEKIEAYENACRQTLISMPHWYYKLCSRHILSHYIGQILTQRVQRNCSPLWFCQIPLEITQRSLWS